jgi:outer membrane protein assembly factor BamA
MSMVGGTDDNTDADTYTYTDNNTHTYAYTVSDPGLSQSGGEWVIAPSFRKDLYEAFAAIGFTADARSARFDPKSGLLWIAQVRTNRLYKGESVPFFQFTNELRYYLPLIFKGDVLSARLRLTLRDTDAGAYHRLTYGGAGEVRGYGNSVIGWNFVANSSALASLKYHKPLFETPPLPVPLVDLLFGGVKQIRFRFDAALIADYARLYGDPAGTLTFSGERQNAMGLGFGTRIVAPAVNQSGCIDLVFGRSDRVDGEKYRWDPMLHIYLDLFY